jgi:PPP family 3-phenylpropionic acid transporter
MRAVPYWRLSAFYFAYFAFLGVFATFFSLYLQSLGHSPAEIAILMSLVHAVRVVTPNFWGWLSDTSGRRVAIIRMAFAAATIAFLGVFFGTGFWWLFAVITLMAIFWSAAMPLFEAAVMDWLGGDAGHYGRIRAWGSAGYIVAVIGAGVTLDAVAIAWVLVMVAVLMAITCATAFTLPERTAQPHEHDRVPIADLFRRRDVVAIFAACFLMCASQGAMFAFYPIYLVEHGYSKTGVGILSSLAVIAEIGVFLVLPAIFRRFTHYQLWTFSFAVTAVRFQLVAWLPDLVAVQAFAQLLHMFTFGTYHATALALIHQRFRGRLQTRGQALYTSLSWGLGGALGGLASGAMWERWGAAATFSLSSAIALAGLAIVVFALGEKRLDAARVPAPR